MPKSKNVWDSTSTLNPLASSFKVLGQPTRLYILNLLLKYDRLNCGQIVDKIPRSQSTVSQHLQDLYKSGFVKVETNGPERLYSINEKKIGKLRKSMLTFIESLEKTV